MIAAAGCGAGDGEGADVGGANDGTSPPTSSPEEKLSLELRVDGPVVAHAPVEWQVVVTNNTDEPITVTCPSGKTADVVLRRDGVERYRWSEGRVFTQALVEVEIPPDGKTLTLSEQSLDVEAGAYEAVATSTCEGAPPPAETTVRVASG